MPNHRLRQRRLVSRLIVDHYSGPGNSVGGCLHVVLDDGNLEDYFLLGAISDAISIMDIRAASLACAIYCIPYPERRKALEKAYVIMCEIENGKANGVLTI